MSEVAHLHDVVRCPALDCGARMWIKSPGYYGCKHGHIMAADAIIAPGEFRKPVVIVQPRAHWPWYRHAEIPWAITALLLVAQIVEVLT